jgi:hypothetical protein
MADRLSSPSRVIGLDGKVKYRNSNGTWTILNNTCAKDIAASSEVWITGCHLGPDGYVHRWNGSSFVMDSTGYSGTRISVDSAGKPWIVRSDGLVYARSQNSVTAGTYYRIGDARSENWMFGSNADIAVALSDGFEQVWVTDTIASPPAVWIWNEQFGEGFEPDDAPPSRKTFIRKPGASGNRVATAPNNPGIVNAPGAISALTYRP